MSAIVIESAECSGIPRLSDVRLGIYENEILDEYEILKFPSEQYFCNQGHSFELTFSPKSYIPSMWECPNCETLAVNYPL